MVSPYNSTLIERRYMPIAVGLWYQAPPKFKLTHQRFFRTPGGLEGG